MLDRLQNPGWLTPLNVGIVALCVVGVVAAAFVQHAFVLGAELQVRLFVVPGLVGFAFGAVLVGIRRVLVVNRRYAAELKDRQLTILELNRDLEARVAKRTQELAEKHAQLLRAQRLEIVGQLSGGVVHDLNNVFAVIVIYADLALEEDDPQERHSALVAISEAVDRAQRLTRQLLATSRRTSDDQELPVAEVVEPLVSMLERAFGSRYQVTLDLDDQGCHVEVARTEQILLNLLVNARDALPSGGNIAVRTSSVWADGRNSAVLEVVDDGPGIPDDIRDRVFEPFFSTKDGTGLGLATVRTLVQQAGGSIELVTGPTGSSFRVVLPCVAATPGADRDSDTPPDGEHEPASVVPPGPDVH